MGSSDLGSPQPDLPERLFHFTSRTQLPSILTMGELLMTPDPFAPPVDGEKWPVLWLSSEGGEEITSDSVRAGLYLDGAHKMGVMGVLVKQDKTEIRIEVRPDFSHMMRWSDWAKATGTAERTIRQMGKWPIHSEWWWVSQREIPQSQWVDIAVRNEEGAWVPMFSAPTVLDEPVEPPLAQPETKSKFAAIAQRFLRG